MTTVGDTVRAELACDCSRPGLFSSLALTLLCLASAVVMLSSVVFIMAFPPYVDNDEEELLLDVLREFPGGIEDNDARDDSHGTSAKVMPHLAVKRAWP